jgi:hypothetical protein
MKRLMVSIKNNVPYVLPNERKAGYVPSLPEKAVAEGRKKKRSSNQLDMSSMRQDRYNDYLKYFLMTLTKKNRAV